MLRCPHCGHAHIWHDDIEVFNRGEDEVRGLHVVIRFGDDRLTVDDNLIGNPSPRRHGLKIWFTCENCRRRHVLVIRQHKGRSYARWLTEAVNLEWLEESKQDYLVAEDEKQ